MRRSKRFGLQGSSRGRKFPLLLVVITITTIIIAGPSSLAAEEDGVCAPVLGRVVSLQGRVEARRAGSQSWVRVSRLDTAVCEGDRLRAGPASRAALFVQPENLIRIDQNSEISVSHSPDETFIEFFQEAAIAAGETAGCGAGYVITRFPKKFRIRTPHVNAAVEGTEFLVALRCESTELAVFEGRVRAQALSSAEEQVLASGQVLAAGLAEPPAIRLLVRPADAVQWALYYPPLSDAGVPVPSANECAQLPAGAIRQVCFAQRAEQSLRAGRVEQAEDEIAQALAESPTSGDALAIRAIVSVVKGDKDGARSAAQKAVEASPNSSRAWLSLSYSQQAHFRLEDALKSVQRAAEISANSSLVQARLAEMYMSLGRTRDAEKAARRAVEANPNEERAHTVLGFVHLAQIQVKAAQIDFQNAIERDSTAPLPRLGLGLSIIRQGQLVQGREQLEIAVALDPTNSLLRSYVGKAYYEENTKERDQLAATQFELAKQLDPNDPTPWFYAAFLKQRSTSPVEAEAELQESIDRNENRAVQRSRLLLEDDFAARSASLASVYQSIGIPQLALSEAAVSLANSPGSDSAHRFLADSYALMPRREVAREAEEFQARMRAPVNNVPIPIHATAAGAFTLSGTGFPSGLNEYGPLFAAEGAAGRVDLMAGTFDTLSGQALVGFMSHNVSATVGTYGFQTEGIRENNEDRKLANSAFVQVQLAPSTQLQMESLSLDREAGDLTQDFFSDQFPELVISPFSNEIELDSARLGVRHQFSASTDVLVSLAHVRREDTLGLVNSDPFLRITGDSSKYELQTATDVWAAKWQVGTSWYEENAKEEFIGFFDTPSHPTQFELPSVFRLPRMRSHAARLCSG